MTYGVLLQVRTEFDQQRSTGRRKAVEDELDLFCGGLRVLQKSPRRGAGNASVESQEAGCGGEKLRRCRYFIEEGGQRFAR
jgi:hypothetical protein